jgi:hypothetical protein
VSTANDEMNAEEILWHRAWNALSSSAQKETRGKTDDFSASTSRAVLLQGI